MSFDKMPRPINGEETVFSTNGSGNTGLSTCKKMESDPYLTSHIKINSKYIKDLNVRPKVAERLHVIGFGSDLLNMTRKTEVN